MYMLAIFTKVLQDAMNIAGHMSHNIFCGLLVLVGAEV